MYPRDAITYVNEITGNTTIVAVSTSTNTILGLRLQQSGTASETYVYCGDTPIAINYAKDYPISIINYVCTDKPIRIGKTGNDTSSFAITYVPRDRNTTFDPPLTATTSTNIEISSSTPLYNGPTYQEFLFVSCVIIAILSINLWRFLFRKRKEA